jgi:hypothetical protein
VLRKNMDDNAEDGTLTDVVTELPYTDETKSSFPMQKEWRHLSIPFSITSGMTVTAGVIWQLDADEDIVVSKYAADLPFVDNGVVIDPNPVSWKCTASATENI